MLVLLQILDVVGVQKHACLAQSFGKKVGLFFHSLYISSAWVAPMILA